MIEEEIELATGDKSKKHFSGNCKMNDIIKLIRQQIEKSEKETVDLCKRHYNGKMDLEIERVREEIENKRGVMAADWNEEFDRDFINLGCAVRDDLKCFIRHLLKAEEGKRVAYKKELAGKIEKIKEVVQKRHGTFKYDSCYDDILSLIK